MLIFVTLLCYAFAAAPNCTRRNTPFYLETGLFLPQVYIGVPDCKEIIPSAAADIWRGMGANLTGFRPMFVVDLVGVPRFQDACGRNILANLVPARADWAGNVEGLCWAAAEAEKRVVLGDFVVESALAAVEKCCVPTPTPGVISVNPLTVMIGVTILFIPVVAAVILTAILVHWISVKSPPTLA